MVETTNFPNGITVGGSPVVAGATFTVGDEANDSINVGVQLLTADGAEVGEACAVWAYLSDDSGGDGVTATAPDGDIAVGTDGVILAEATADKVFLLLSEADGDIDLDIGEAAAGTWYLVVILPGGGLAVSGAITFEA